MREIWSGRSWARVTRPEWTKAEIAARSDFWQDGMDNGDNGDGLSGGFHPAQISGSATLNAMGGMMMHHGMGAGPFGMGAQPDAAGAPGRAFAPSTSLGFQHAAMPGFAAQQPGAYPSFWSNPMAQFPQLGGAAGAGALGMGALGFPAHFATHSSIKGVAGSVGMAPMPGGLPKAGPGVQSAGVDFREVAGAGAGAGASALYGAPPQNGPSAGFSIGVPPLAGAGGRGRGPAGAQQLSGGA